MLLAKWDLKTTLTAIVASSQSVSAGIRLVSMLQLKCGDGCCNAANLVTSPYNGIAGH